MLTLHSKSRNRMFFFVLLVLILMMKLYNLGEAVSMEQRLGIALNYPGIGIRYGLSHNFVLEGKCQFGSGITVSGFRGYYNIKPKERTNLFVGLETDMVTFKGETSEGDGIAVEVFFGGEYFLTQSLGLQLDFGPAFISLTDKSTKVKQEGVEYVINVDINYYFGGEK